MSSAPIDPVNNDGERKEHPLQNTWSFWEHRKGVSNEYGSNMHRLGDFSTVEEFWRYYNNIPRPSAVFYTMQIGKKRFADREVDGFSLFKKGIRPEWEDDANMKGGEFCVRKSLSPSDLDQHWETLCLGLVGETIDPDDEICGARVVDKSRGKGDRPTYRIEVWFRSQDEGVRETLKRKITECLGQPLLTEFRAHSQAMHHHGHGGRGR